MKTILYIDGFNLYFRALQKRRGLRWLNVQALAEELLFEDNEIIETNYFTARVNDRIDPGADVRQDAYLRALKTLPDLKIHYGKFATRRSWAKLCHPPVFRPEAEEMDEPWPETVRIIRSEEKGSDVNLAVQLVRDGFQGRFDVAVVITNDTDLEGAIRTVKEDAGLPVVLLSPVPEPHRTLREAASSVKIIRASHLKKSQFPDEIATSHGRVITRPETWREDASEREN